MKHKQKNSMMLQKNPIVYPEIDIITRTVAHNKIHKPHINIFNLTIS